MAWTVERIASHLAIDDDRARTVLGLVRGTVDPFSVPAVDAWRRKCYHEPDPKCPDTIMRAIDATIDTHGTETIDGSKHHDRFWQSACAVYCNAGDTYAATVLYDTVRGRYVLTTMGDFVERFERRYGIQ